MSKLNEVIGRGVIGSRPVAGIAGRLYYDTTNSILYRDSGSVWESVSAAVGALTGTTAGTFNIGSSGSTGIVQLGAGGPTMVGDAVEQTTTFEGAAGGYYFSDGAINGDGSALTNLPAGELTGTVPDARISGSYTSAVTMSNAGNVFSGKIIHSTASYAYSTITGGDAYLVPEGIDTVFIDTYDSTHDTTGDVNVTLPTRSLGREVTVICISDALSSVAVFGDGYVFDNGTAPDPFVLGANRGATVCFICDGTFWNVKSVRQ